MSSVSIGASPIHGTGVFATLLIVKGHPIRRIDDTRIVDAAHPLSTEAGEHDHHCDYLAGGTVVLMASPERHINHSGDPNTFIRTVAGVRYVFALSDIAAGEEITFDYCLNSSSDTVWACRCGAPNCRETIHSDFFHLPLNCQRAYLPFLEDWFVQEHVEQIKALFILAGI